eukprot:TRINITY_DN26911_c0_g1_i1.p1 TRINITY_DN26911_c0_g1~~TRINITY_DN26911_c0_g1_i1.p1  ORF type:complete len:142 (+),score=16.40 TRINITY_DN26911_c0_g1_i1:52-477(+)
MFPLQMQHEDVWGVTIRLSGALVACHFAGLLQRRQVLALLGERGLFPATLLLRQMAESIPSLPKRCVFFPTVLHVIGASDAALIGLCDLGLALAVLGPVLGLLNSQICSFAANLVRISHICVVLYFLLMHAFCVRCSNLMF